MMRAFRILTFAVAAAAWLAPPTIRRSLAPRRVLEERVDAAPTHVLPEGESTVERLDEASTTDAAPSHVLDVEALEWKLLKSLRSCVLEYGMIEDGAKVLVACSGGKDSNALLYLLKQAQRRRLFRGIDFDVVAVHLDQKQPGHDVEPLRAWLEDDVGVDFQVIEEDTYSVVVDKTKAGKSYCSLCSRLRRGILYTHAERRGAGVLALGHHRDDALETLLLNMVHNGQLKSMPARYVASRGRRRRRHVRRSRPSHADAMAFPILPCNLCGSQPSGTSQRGEAKLLLHALDAFAGADDARRYMLRARSDAASEPPARPRSARPPASTL
ncbi:hypothetical protein JL720_3293 [Aureococcus anophagefferens]|nr:hypothetical protein JL720_3293 [Aureococcus anophagefferens]